MARKRKDPKDNKLPPRVSKSKTSYYLKTKDNKTITLGLLSMSMTELWAKYEGVISEQRIEMTFSKLWGMFTSSPEFTSLAHRTQKDYFKHSKKILSVFGVIKADNIKPSDIRKYMDIRGTQSKVQANHEKSDISRVYRWGYERGYVNCNPCNGVSSFRIATRDQYAEDADYYVLLEAARPSVKIAMEIAYLCAMRISDVISIQYNQILDDGVYAVQGKTGVKQIKLWTDRLKDIFDYAKKTFPPKNQESFLILNAFNLKYSYRNFNEHWNDDKKKAEKILGHKINFTFHDLKAKGISDFDGSSKDKQQFSGHKTESQVLVYDRKIKKSPTLNIPKVTKNS